MKRIALVGTAPSSALAPKDWDEIWSVNVRLPHLPRVDRLFQIHRLAGEGNYEGWLRDTRKYAQESEVWMFWPEDVSKNVIQFPVEHIAGKYGTFFMTSTFAWMLALAIDELRDEGGEIGLWGIDMEYGTEYAQQRAGVQHFKDLAVQLGLTVTELVTGGLAPSPIPYPFWEDDPLTQKLAHRKGILEKHKKESQAAQRLVEDRVTGIDASVRDLRDVLAGKTRVANRIQTLLKEREGHDPAPFALKIAFADGVIEQIEHTEALLKP